MDTSEVENRKRAKHRLPREAADAVRGHLVTSNQEVSAAVVLVQRRQHHRCVPPGRASSKAAESFSATGQSELTTSSHQRLSAAWFAELHSFLYGVPMWMCRRHARKLSTIETPFFPVIYSSSSIWIVISDAA
jgi:hypothetical protein